MEKEILENEYYNIGVGDKVRLTSRAEMEENFCDYVDGCGYYENQIVTIDDIFDSHFYIKENHGENYFGMYCIKEIVEKTAEMRAMSSGVFRHLKRGDKILLKDSMSISHSWNGNRQMGDYGNCIVTVKDVGINSLTIVEDRQKFTWNQDLILSKILNYKEPTQEEIDEALRIEEYVHEVNINSSYLDNCERLNQLELVKITNDVETIVRNYNTRRFAEYLAGKWVIVSMYNSRVYNSLNPHIDKGLKFLKCPNWKLDYYSNCVTERKILDKRPLLNRVLQVNFETGEITDVLLTDTTRCCVCGAKLEETTHYGRYCRSCLTTRHGLAYRYGYHDYQDGYPTPKGIDTTEVPVFGCEIERDYSAAANKTYDGFNRSCENAMVDFVVETQGEQLENANAEREVVFMSDGSLNSGGIEIITFPHTFDWYIENKDKLDRALQAIKNRGFKDTQKAGNHIHINRDFFTLKNGKSTAKFCAAKMAVLFNRYWDAFCSIARRVQTRYTQKPNQEYDDDIFTIVEKTLHSQHAHGVAVNLQHDATIEIRLWSAIRNADDLLFFLDNMQALAQYVKKYSLETVQKAKFSDFMKFYKLKTSLSIAKSRFRRKPLLKSYYDEICALEQKMKSKGENK